MILSLDLSFSATGYSIYDKKKLIHAGVIKIPKLSDHKQTNFNARVGYLAQKLQHLVAGYKIKEIYFEDLIGAQSAVALKVLTACKTVAICVANFNGLPYKVILPKDMKKFITGDFHATKDQIMEVAIKAYPNAYLETDPVYKKEAIADSVGIYISLSSN